MEKIEIGYSKEELAEEFKSSYFSIDTIIIMLGHYGLITYDEKIKKYFFT